MCVYIHTCYDDDSDIIPLISPITWGSGYHYEDFDQ